jgi:TonB family protein
MGAQLMHRAPVNYPREALAKNLEGVIVAQVKLDDSGNVADASILSGPDELRKTVLQSLLSWHFTKDAAGGTRQISVAFRKPAEPTPAAMPQAREAVITRDNVTVTAPTLPTLATANRKSVETAPLFSNPAAHTIRSISVEGLGIPTDEVLAKLPLHVNDEWTPEGMSKLIEAVHQIDEHLVVSASHLPPGNVAIRISAPRTEAATSLQPTPAGTLNVGGRVQANKLISNPQPEYPVVARQARISGTVSLQALIGPDGHIQSLTVISGHPLLRQAALDAVKQWVYQPTLLNEKPVSVSTTIDVIFSLSEN